MNSIIEAQPSAIRHLSDATLFYFGSQSPDINLLPGNAKFDIVYSPTTSSNWELVRYQWFEEKNGVAVLERRHLEADEILHFERLLAAAQKPKSTQPLSNRVGV